MNYYLPLAALAALWGASFLFLRIASPEFGPFSLIFVRTALATIVLLPFVSGYRFLKDYGLRFIVIGSISTAIPFSLISFASIYLSAGLTSILNATVPFFSAVLAVYFLGEHFTLKKIIGLILGFLGVAVLSSKDLVTTQLLGVLPLTAVLLAALFYAASSIVVKLKLQSLTPLEVTVGSQFYSALLLLPFALLTWPEESISLSAWVSAGCLAVFSTALALIIFFRLLTVFGVTRTVSVTYLIPLFGVAWGALFLNEPVGISMVAGGVTILLGVAFTSAKFRKV